MCTHTQIGEKPSQNYFQDGIRGEIKWPPLNSAFKPDL